MHGNNFFSVNNSDSVSRQLVGNSKAKLPAEEKKTPDQVCYDVTTKTHGTEAGSDRTAKTPDCYHLIVGIILF